MIAGKPTHNIDPFAETQEPPLQANWQKAQQLGHQ